ncbi:SseB family protein [Streptomyces sp. RP5T]|nr:SseB family protein [Streptomyces sp. RP5T]
MPDPGFSDDDGSADPRLSAALAAWAEDGAAVGPVLEALKGARLLVPVVAVLGEVEEDENGLRREKTSDMAVPTLKAGSRTALPAFTSTDSLARWDPKARPVAVPLRQALQAAAHEKADTVVLDLAGPVPFELTGPALLALAVGRCAFAVRLPEQPLGYLLALVLAVLAALALGAVVSALSRTTKIAGAIGSAVFFPAMFCAGVWAPVQTMPDVLARIVGYTPFGAAAEALNRAAAGDWPGWTRLGVLVAWTALLTAAASRWFRWE